MLDQIDLQFHQVAISDAVRDAMDLMVASWSFSCCRNGVLIEMA